MYKPQIFLGFFTFKKADVFDESAAFGLLVWKNWNYAITKVKQVVCNKRKNSFNFAF